MRFGESDSSVAWASTQVYGPTRKPMLDYSDANDSYDGAPLTFGPYATAPMLYQNRSGTNDYEYTASLAGWHYVGVKLDPNDDGEVPLTLDVTVVGDEIPGPEYAGDGLSTGDSTETSRQRTAEHAIVAGETTSVRPPWWLLGGVGAGLAAVAVLAVVLARRRAR